MFLFSVEVESEEKKKERHERTLRNVRKYQNFKESIELMSNNFINKFSVTQSCSIDKKESYEALLFHVFFFLVSFLTKDTLFNVLQFKIGDSNQMESNRIKKDDFDKEFNQNFYAFGETADCLQFENFYVFGETADRLQFKNKVYATFGVKGNKFLMLIFSFENNERVPGEGVELILFCRCMLPLDCIFSKYKQNVVSQDQAKDSSQSPINTSFQNQVNKIPPSQSFFMKNFIVVLVLISLVSLVFYFIFKTKK